MANQFHLHVLAQGVENWNRWRAEHPDVRPDLREASLQMKILSGADLTGANLSGAHLEGAGLDKAILVKADLRGANLCGAQSEGGMISGITLKKPKIDLGGKDITWTSLDGARLSDADLTGADISGASLRHADFTGARLDGANLTWANLEGSLFVGATLREAQLHGAYLTLARFERANLERADLEGARLEATILSEANLTGANLEGATLLGADVTQAIFNDCYIYGVSVWNLQGEAQKQHDLVITRPCAPHYEPLLTVDDLEIAQFIYLLVNNRKIRKVIDTMTSKAVLILGRFTPERKVILDALRDHLRAKGFLPILFDFDKPSHRNLTETVGTLAGLARFVIADLTDAKSIPQELQRIIPENPSLPVCPIILSSQVEYAMFRDFLDYLTVLPPYRYRSLEELSANLEENVIAPALAKTREIKDRRRVLESAMAG